MLLLRYLIYIIMVMEKLQTFKYEYGVMRLKCDSVVIKITSCMVAIFLISYLPASTLSSFPSSIIGLKVFELT